MFKTLVLMAFVCIGFKTLAQEKCSIEEYKKQELNANSSLQGRLDAIDAFTKEKIGAVNQARQANHVPEVVVIPVVVHVLYHTPDENIPAAFIENMIAALNRDFRKKNPDTTNTPSVFKALGVDMGFEFKLATMDPRGVGTSGIVRKYTPIQFWLSDDKMKFSSSYGDDGWASGSYMNIWLCNMKDVLGYSTFPGMDAKKDGIVISFENFVNLHGSTTGINDNRTIVHEVGHWLNLQHIWGDGYCGDDGVDDTPKQGSYTPGCPTGMRISCGNNSTGDMYMNYMDFTDDPCMNMFTKGQKKRARVLFEEGGPRNSILISKGLNSSTILSAQLPDFYPKWLYAQVYPNPASSSINVYFEYDERWIGKELQVVDMSGKVVVSKIIKSKIQQIDVSRLNAGIYFLRSEKEGEKLHAKFVKL